MEKHLILFLSFLMLIPSCSRISDYLKTKKIYHIVKNYRINKLSRRIAREMIPDSLMHHFPDNGEGADRSVLMNVSTSFYSEDFRCFHSMYELPWFHSETVRFTDVFDYCAHKARFGTGNHFRIVDYQADNLIPGYMLWFSDYSPSPDETLIILPDQVASDTSAFTCILQYGTRLVLPQDLKKEFTNYLFLNYQTGISFSDQFQDITSWVYIWPQEGN